MKITVFVTPKPTVLDPQGQTVQHAMHSLGQAASNVRVGKTIAFNIEGEDTPEFRAGLDKLCKSLLSNPIIEDYHYTIQSQPIRQDALSAPQDQPAKNLKTPALGQRP